MATIGELIINLRASTAAFSKDLDKAMSLSFDSAKAIERSFTVATKAIGIAVGAAAASLVALVEKTSETGEHMAHLSQSTGISIETLSQLGYVAKMGGIDLDTFATNVERLSKKLFDAASGNEKMSETFARFGVDAKTATDMTDVLVKLNSTFYAMPEGITRTGAAMALFGKAGAAMLPFLTMAPDKFHALMLEVKDLGGVWTKEGAEAATAFQENLKRLHTVLDALAIKVTLAVLPAFDQLILSLVDIAKHPEGLTSFFDIGIRLAKEFAIALVVCGTEIRNFAADAELLGGIWARATAQESLPLSDAWANYQAKVTRNFKQGFALAGSIENPPPVSDPMKSLLSSFGGSGLGDLGQLTDAEKKIQSIIDKLKEHFATIGMDSDAVGRWKLEQLGAGDAVLKKYDELTDKINKFEEVWQAMESASANGLPRVGPINEAAILSTQSAKITGVLDDSQAIANAEDANRILQEWGANMSAAAAAIHDQVIPAQQRFEIEQENMNTLVKYFGLSQADANKHMQDYAIQLGLATDKQKAMLQMENQLKNGLANMFTNVIFHAESFKQAIGELLLQMGELIFKLLVMKPLLDMLIPTKGGVGGSLSTLFGGFLAGGGSALAGQAYIVGEKGPEWFVPNSSGKVVPNGAGGSAVVNYNIDARGADAGAEERIRAALRETENRAVQRALVTGRELQLRTV